MPKVEGGGFWHSVIYVKKRGISLCDGETKILSSLFGVEYVREATPSSDVTRDEVEDPLSIAHLLLLNCIWICPDAAMVLRQHGTPDQRGVRRQGLPVRARHSRRKGAECGAFLDHYKYKY